MDGDKVMCHPVIRKFVKSPMCYSSDSGDFFSGFFTTFLFAHVIVYVSLTLG